MDVKLANIYKAGAFKQAKLFLSNPEHAEKLVLYSETGFVEPVELPLSALGFVISTKEKMAWNIIQKLKIYVEGLGVVTPISERSRLPLDPHGILTEEERASMAPLDVIHKDSYSRAWARLSNKEKEGPNERTVTRIIWILGGLIALSLLIMFVRGCA